MVNISQVLQVLHCVSSIELLLQDGQVLVLELIGGLDDSSFAIVIPGCHLHVVSALQGQVKGSFERVRSHRNLEADVTPTPFLIKG